MPPSYDELTLVRVSPYLVASVFRREWRGDLDVEAETHRGSPTS